MSTMKKSMIMTLMLAFTASCSSSHTKGSAEDFTPPDRQIRDKYLIGAIQDVSIKATCAEYKQSEDNCKKLKLEAFTLDLTNSYSAKSNDMELVNELRDFCRNSYETCRDFKNIEDLARGLVGAKKESQEYLRKDQINSHMHSQGLMHMSNALGNISQGILNQPKPVNCTTTRDAFGNLQTRCQ